MRRATGNGTSAHRKSERIKTAHIWSPDFDLIRPELPVYRYRNGPRKGQIIQMIPNGLAPSPLPGDWSNPEKMGGRPNMPRPVFDRIKT